jgi:hypothetical protein
VYWNTINNNLKLKQLSDEGLMDHKAQENTRGFFAPSCHPDRKDDAYMNTFGGVPLEPDTTKSTQANNQSSNALDVKTSMSDLMKGVGEGDRHKSCTRLSGLLFSKGFSYGDVLQLILGWNKLCTPPQDEHTVSETVRSISQYYADKLVMGDEATMPVIDEDGKPVPKRDSYLIQEAKDLPPVEWLIKDVLQERCMSAIYGDSGCTKSFLAIDQGMHLALGLDWFGHKTYRVAPVIYVAVEGGGGLINRINGWLQANDYEAPDNFYVDFDCIYPTQKESIQNFINYYKDKGFTKGIIYIDTLNANARSDGIDENSPRMAEVIDCFQQIGKALDSGYELIHHTGKDKSKGMRGHYSTYASMDTVIYVEAEANERYSWTIQKQKEGQDEVSFGYRTEKIEVGKDSEGQPITTLVIEPEGAITRKEARETFRGHQRKLFDMLKDYLLPKPNARDSFEGFLDYVYANWTAIKSDQRRSKARNGIQTMERKGLFKLGNYEDYLNKKIEYDQIWITEKGMEY